MCVLIITIVFNYFSLYICIYIVIVSLMSVHTCIILVSMYLHCYSEFNVSPHMYYFSIASYSYVSTLLHLLTT